MLDGANMGLSHVGAILELTWAVRVLLGTLWASASVLGASWSHLGASCSIFKRLGGVLGPSWAALELLGASWWGPGGILGEPWEGLGLGASWGSLGRVLAGFPGGLGASWGAFGRSWAAPGLQGRKRSKKQFFLGHLGAILGLCWAILRCHVVRRAKVRKTR